MRGLAQAIGPRFDGRRKRFANEDVVAVLLDNHSPCGRSERLDVFHAGLARHFVQKRIDARLPHVALHMLDESGVDALALLVLKGGASLLLAADNAGHQRAVDLQRIAADRSAFGKRELELALKNALVGIGERDGRGDTTEQSILRGNFTDTLDNHRFLVLAQLTRPEDRRRYRHFGRFRHDGLHLRARNQRQRHHYSGYNLVHGMFSFHPKKELQRANFHSNLSAQSKTGGRSACDTPARSLTATYFTSCAPLPDIAPKSLSASSSG